MLDDLLVIKQVLVCGTESLGGSRAGMDKPPRVRFQRLLAASSPIQREPPVSGHTGTLYTEGLPWRFVWQGLTSSFCHPSLQTNEELSLLRHEVAMIRLDGPEDHSLSPRRLEAPMHRAIEAAPAPPDSEEPWEQSENSLSATVRRP
jgi:hypothetical protein